MAARAEPSRHLAESITANGHLLCYRRQQRGGRARKVGPISASLAAANEAALVCRRPPAQVTGRALAAWLRSAWLSWARLCSDGLGCVRIPTISRSSRNSAQMARNQVARSAELPRPQPQPRPRSGGQDRAACGGQLGCASLIRPRANWPLGVQSVRKSQRANHLSRPPSLSVAGGATGCHGCQSGGGEPTRRRPFRQKSAKS